MNVLVIGDCMVDRYWVGGSTRNNPDGPQPLVRIDSRIDLPGGAANVAANLTAWGVDAFLPEGVDPRPIKNRILNGQRVVLRFDEDVELKPLSPSDLAVLGTMRDWDAVVVADYAKGSVDDCVVDWIRSLGKPTYVDCKVHPERWVDWAECAFPNLAEYSKHADVYDNCACALFVKKGALGSVFKDRPPDVKHRDFRSVVREVVNPTGAGDTAMAAYVFATLRGAHTAEACEFAMAASAVAVESQLTCAPTMEAIAKLGDLFAARQIRGIPVP